MAPNTYISVVYYVPEERYALLSCVICGRGERRYDVADDNLAILEAACYPHYQLGNCPEAAALIGRHVVEIVRSGSGEVFIDPLLGPPLSRPNF